MAKKVLFTANLESFFTKFLIPQLKYFKESGYEVHIATKLENKEIPYIDKKYDVDFARGFNIKQNINSYKQMKKIFKNEHYDIVSCHTPFGGAITRLAFKNCKVRIMPDVHAGKGCVIGFTADLGDKVIPNIVKIVLIFFLLSF